MTHNPDSRQTAVERLRGLSFDGRYLRLGGRAIADMRYANNRENAEALVLLADPEKAAKIVAGLTPDLDDGHDHVTIRVDRKARVALVARLMEPDMVGVGYTEFILRAVAQSRARLEGELDVDAVAKALHKSNCKLNRVAFHSCHFRGAHLKGAPIFAREYAALAVSGEEPK